MSINMSNVNDFLREIKQLQVKYGIFIRAEYEEDLDYNWDDELVCVGVRSNIVLCDINDNCYSLDTDEIYMQKM